MIFNNGIFCWRITKYNPQYRTKNGAYSKDEWTCHSDVGKVFEGKQLTFDEYLKIENAYVQVIISFFECSNISSVKIVDLEKDGKRPKKISSIDDIKEIKNNAFVNKETAIAIIRLILRNKIWCKFEAEEFYVHFGYDYYMYVGSSKSCEHVIESIEKTGLFVEPFQSPYSE